MTKENYDLDEIKRRMLTPGYKESDDLKKIADQLGDFEKRHGGVRIHLDGDQGSTTIYRDGTVVMDEGMIVGLAESGEFEIVKSRKNLERVRKKQKDDNYE